MPLAYHILQGCLFVCSICQYKNNCGRFNKIIIQINNNNYIYGTSQVPHMGKTELFLSI